MKAKLGKFVPVRMTASDERSLRRLARFLALSRSGVVRELIAREALRLGLVDGVPISPTRERAA